MSLYLHDIPSSLLLSSPHTDSLSLSLSCSPLYCTCTPSIIYVLSPLVIILMCMHHVLLSFQVSIFDFYGFRGEMYPRVRPIPYSSHLPFTMCMLRLDSLQPWTSSLLIGNFPFSRPNLPFLLSHVDMSIVRFTSNVQVRTVHVVFSWMIRYVPLYDLCTLVVPSQFMTLQSLHNPRLILILRDQFEYLTWMFDILYMRYVHPSHV